MAADHKIKVQSFDQERPDKVRILIAEMFSGESDWEEREGLSYFKEPNLLVERFEELLSTADTFSVGLVLFPELSVQGECTHLIQNWSRKSKAVAVAGSHYHRTGNTICNRSPIFVAGEAFYTEKIIPAPVEVSPISAQSLRPGNEIKVFANTTVGNFAALICSDYLDPTLRQSVFEAVNVGLDILCVPAFQKDSRVYHERMALDCDTAKDGLYILYSNMRCGTIGDGKSAVFGIMDHVYVKKLVEGRLADPAKPQKLLEIPRHYDYAVLELDIRQKRPYLGRTIYARPNVSILTVGATGAQKGELSTSARSTHINNGWLEHTPPKTPLLRGLGAHALRVRAHMFVPFACESELSQHLHTHPAAEAVECEWIGSYRTLHHGRAVASACIFPFGTLLLHLCEELSFDSITSLALWRRKIYKDMLDAPNAALLNYIADCALIRSSAWKQMSRKQGFVRPSYVLSFYNVLEVTWDNSDYLANGIALLSVPSQLIPHTDGPVVLGEDENGIKRRAVDAERGFLRQGLSDQTVRRFGLADVAIGCASWAGVAYFAMSEDRAIPESTIVRLETAVQALWNYCDLVPRMLRADGTKSINREYEASYLRQCLNRLTSPHPREHLQVCLMREAIVETSRLRTKMEEAIRSLLEYH